MVIKNEIQRIIQEYRRLCASDKVTDRQVNELYYKLQRAINCEEPDGYYCDGSIFTIFEHFEFDSFFNSNKGSKFKRENANIEKVFYKNAVNSNNNVIFQNSVIDCEINSEYFIRNAINSFKIHANKIDRYIKNLKNDGILENQKIEVIFLIENSTELGSIDKVRGGIVDLFTIKEFLDIFEKESRVTAVAYYAKVPSNADWDCCFSYLDNTNIDIYRNNERFISNVGLAGFKHNIFGFDVKIDKENENA